MTRYSVSVSFVPRIDMPGQFMMYVTYNTWEGGKCLDSVNIVHQFPVRIQDAKTKAELWEQVLDCLDAASDAVSLNQQAIIDILNSKTDARSLDA